MYAAFALYPALAFALCLALHLLALRIFPRLGLLDFPQRYGLQRPRLPYPTGVVSIVVFILFFSVLQAWSLKTAGVLFGVGLLAVTAFIDDRTPLPSWLRLLVQIGIALAVFLTGTRIFSLTNPLELLNLSPVIPLDRLVIPSRVFSNPSIFGALFTLLWLGLTMNALNWFDGIPGQVTVLSTIGFLTIGLLSLSSRVNDPSLAELAFVLAGISGACVLFDFPPPHVVLGDSGAMFFGLMLGILTIYSGGKVATAFLVLGIPLIDLFFVIVQRIAKGNSPMRGNAKNEHLHHRLLARGWTPRQIITLTAGLGGLFGITALFLSTFEKFLAALALVFIMLLLSIFSRTKEVTGSR